MWLYVQRTGALYHNDKPVAVGYSGLDEDKNRPESQHIHNRGPIPCGVYRIGDNFDSKTHGPFCLPLTPDLANEMFGRSDFLIAGDSVLDPGRTGEDCIVLYRGTRERIYSSRDRELHVVVD